MSSWGDTGQADQYRQTRIWSFHGRTDRLLAKHNRETIAATQEAGGTPLYTETNGGHEIWGPIYDDPNNDLYAWMFEEATPPLATFLYNPQTGSVKIDAKTAPGGAINIFKINFKAGFFSLPSTVRVGGTTVDSSNFFRTANDTALFFDDRNGEGLREVLDFGPVLPTGLDFVSLHDVFDRQVYSSPATGRHQRI